VQYKYCKLKYEVEYEAELSKTDAKLSKHMVEHEAKRAMYAIRLTLNKAEISEARSHVEEFHERHKYEDMKTGRS
jgi:hypothetical protein